MVYFNGDSFVVNGKRYPVEDDCFHKAENFIVGRGECLAFGDNVPQSVDSRYFFCRNQDFLVPYDSVIVHGRVVAKVNI